MSSSNRRTAIIVVVLLAAAAVAAAVVLTRRSSDDTAAPAAAGSPTTTGLPSTSSTSGVAPTGPAPSLETPATSGPTSEVPPPTSPVTTLRGGPFTTPDMPLQVAVTSPTTGLRNGDVVRVKVVPKGDAAVYGVEARLCAGDARVDQDPEFRPTQGGNCIGRALNPGSDNLVTVPVAPPYREADVSFRVGVGTDTFPLQDGGTATVTCGPANPCQVVLKLQYPKAFGFQSIPVTFAS